VKRYQPTKAIKRIDTYKPGEGRGPKNTYCVYGTSGSGKTTFAGTFPKPMLIIDISDDGDDSLEGIEGIDFTRPTSFEEFERIYWFLKQGKHRYKTVVIDTMTELQGLIVRSMADSNPKIKKKGKSAGAWGTLTQNQWAGVSDAFRTQVINFRALEMHTVFLAQQKVTEIDYSDGDDGIDDVVIPEVGPSAMKSIASILCSGSSFIGNTFIRNRTVKKELKRKRITEYCMRVGPNPVYVTKVRKPKSVELPDFITDPSFEDLAKLRNGTWQSAKPKTNPRKSRKARRSRSRV
jgi:AAA domain